jgi:hypothetical protein
MWFSAHSRSKRSREDPVHNKRTCNIVTLDDVLHDARIIMENDPFKHKAPQEENRSYRALFGCGPEVTLALWNRLVDNDGAGLPDDVTVKHLLWTLMYCKQYGKWKTMRKLTNTDPKTLRKWIAVILNAVELIESDVVSAAD